MENILKGRGSLKANNDFIDDIREEAKYKTKYELLCFIKDLEEIEEPSFEQLITKEIYKQEKELRQCISNSILIVSYRKNK